jgi:ribosomal protein S28E/S33
MKEFVSKLLSNKLVEARNILEDRIKDLVDEKLSQVKMRLSAEFELDEANVLKMGRTKLVKVRVRKGKIQRRKKFSNVKGYTIRNGKLTRMLPAERRHRKIAVRRSKFKRRAKLKQSLRKRNISLRKRRAMGL